MEFCCGSGDLSALLRRVSRAATAAHDGGPLRIDAATDGTLTATAADSDLTITSTADAEEVASPGSVVLPGRLAAAAVRSLPAGPVRVASTAHRCRITGEAGALFTLALLDPETLTPAPPPATPPRPAPGLRSAVSRVLSAAARDQSRQHLCSVRIHVGDGWCHTTATDSYRLAASAASLAAAETDTAMLIPTRAAEELLSLFDPTDTLTAAADASTAAFASATGSCLVTRLVPGAFPDVERLLVPSPDDTVAVPFDTAALTEIVSRVRLVADCNGGHVSLAAAGGALTVSAAAPQIGDSSQSLPVATEAACEQLSLNPRFLLDGLESLSPDGARLLVSASNAPVRLADDDDFVYLLMPSARSTT